jgi:hypothetical protein
MEWNGKYITKFIFCSVYFFDSFVSFLSIIFRVWKKLTCDVCIKVPSDLCYVREYFLGEECSSTQVVKESSSFIEVNFSN